jgi:hypothetical protein
MSLCIEENDKEHAGVHTTKGGLRPKIRLKNRQRLEANSNNSRKAPNLTQGLLGQEDEHVSHQAHLNKLKINKTTYSARCQVVAIPATMILILHSHQVQGLLLIL